MSYEGRCCGGRCGYTSAEAMSRRAFMGRVATGTVAIALAGEMALAENGDEVMAVAAPVARGAKAYAMTRPRVYRGRNLEAVAMPIGGIGTGSIWLNGRGQLSVWQIYNNLNETRTPDSFFAMSVKEGEGPRVTRVLQTASEGGLKPMESVEYEGGYPIARLTFRDSALPVEVLLEGMNPMIPLDAANSSIPCAIFRVTAKNTGSKAVEVGLFASLQNAVGSGGAGGISGVKFGGYGGNRNRVLRDGGMVAVAMDKSADPVATGPVKVRTERGMEVSGPEMYWMAGVSDLTAETAGPVARAAAEGGVVLLEGVGAFFFETLEKFRAAARDFSSVATVFEDFENGYGGWKLTGTAFGASPSKGTEPSQQVVTGFNGRALVNTYQGGDGPQGTATSRAFKIERRYIGFLIGGGSHRNQTCVNLRVGDRVVRTATGKDREALEAASWDVGDLRGQEAVIEIVDRNSGPWGHINVDQIIFSDVPPEGLLSGKSKIGEAAKALELVFTGAEEVEKAGEVRSESVKDAGVEWKVGRYTKLKGFGAGEKGYRVLEKTAEGEALVIEGPLGKGRVIMALAGNLPWSWGSAMMVASRGLPLKAGERVVPGHVGWGTMALAAMSEKAVGLAGWTEAAEWGDFVGGRRNGGAEEVVSPGGQTINGALGVPLKLGAGESGTVTFAITWHFPNVQRFEHRGNYYSRRWADAMAAARHLARNLEALWGRTVLYHETVYQSNLPEEFLDAMTSQSVILRGPTCWWSEAGYFAGFEGSYGCCPLNCTHVWNYAQTHARLYPTIGRNMRISNFVTFLHASGETSHREHTRHEAFIDGHCACIEGALREHQMSVDQRFLAQIWPGVKKAVDWLIGAIDKGGDGMPHGHQWNTYDTAVSGENTFIGSQYLAALAAGETMAKVMNDEESAKRWRAVREAGMKNQDEKLWDGEYYIQRPEARSARDYNTGCHADQLLGQWWAHMLDLGYLYPPARVKKALEAVARHNYRENFVGFKQVPRRYVPDDEGGLIICTWPKGGRPKEFILYADEIWTGIEYAAAGGMVYEGLMEEARKIVKMARSRYDGRRRDGLDSGPGGNPFNELECGKFYARAMSSWSLLIASQGLVLDGPRGILGFRPKWQPEDHRSFFTGPEGWGLFVQERKAGEQTERIEVRHGRLRLKEMVFELPGEGSAKATVTIGGEAAGVVVKQAGRGIRLVLEKEAVVSEGSAVEVRLGWG